MKDLNELKVEILRIVASTSVVPTTPLMTAGPTEIMRVCETVNLIYQQICCEKDTLTPSKPSPWGYNERPKKSPNIKGRVEKVGPDKDKPSEAPDAKGKN